MWENLTWISCFTAREGRLNWKEAYSEADNAAKQLSSCRDPVSEQAVCSYESFHHACMLCGCIQVLQSDLEIGQICWCEFIRQEANFHIRLWAALDQE